MKSIIVSLLLACSLMSCTNVKQTADSAASQAKSNLSVGLSTGKSPIGSGYEVNGHASTNIFGVRPYASFTAGISYVPKEDKELPSVDVEPSK